MLSRPWSRHHAKFAIAVIAAVALMAAVLVLSESRGDELAVSTRDRSETEADAPTSRQTPGGGSPVPSDRSGEQAEGSGSSDELVVAKVPDAGSDGHGPSSSPGTESDGSAGADEGPSSGGSPGRSPSPDGSSNPGEPSEEPIVPGASEPIVPIVPAMDPIEPEDFAGCAELGRVAIGQVTNEVVDLGIVKAGTRFRDSYPSLQAQADELDGGKLVCGGPMTRNRGNLIEQSIYIGGEFRGHLVGGDGPQDPVLPLTPLEWLAWDWHAAGGPSGTNFTGIPLGRSVVNGYPVILTSHGAIVIERADTIGVPVVFGAWEIWQRDGARMGAPATIPIGFGVDADQGFDNGYLHLPGVTNPYEAAARSIEDYKWIPLEGNVVGGDVVPNSLMEVQGRSYWVDHSGVRHWIRTTGQWNCARWRLGASLIGPVHVSRMAAAPLGPQFECPPTS